VYYQINNLDSRIQNPDQRLTNDIDKWANALSTIYSNFTKPVLDILLFGRELSNLVGYSGPLSVLVYYLVSGYFIKFISPPFGRLTAQT
jgi:ATP-binding cassette subfamily D (ALD) protein 3